MKRAIQTFKTRSKQKTKAWNSTQIKDKNSHELILIRPQTQNKVPEHTHLSLPTPLRQPVEKTANLHGIKSVIYTILC